MGNMRQLETRFSTYELRTVPPILQVSKHFRAKGTPFHDYIELKFLQRDARGLIYLPSADMIFISKAGAEKVTPQAFRASLIASKSLQKVKSIALSVAHPKFSAFVKDFKNYGGLELVFMVLTEMGEAGDRRWGLENTEEIVDTRLTCKKEILFEVIDPSNLWVTNVSIPGVFSKSRALPIHREPEVMEQLVMEMARGQGNVRVAPNVRFVRLVKCFKEQHQEEAIETLQLEALRRRALEEI
jgi:hypothetical protein